MFVCSCVYVYILVFFLSAFFVSSFCFTFVYFVCLFVFLREGKKVGTWSWMGWEDQGGDEAGKHD